MKNDNDWWQDQSNENKLKYEMFLRNIRKQFFTLRMPDHRHRLLREIVDVALISEIIKSHLDIVLGDQL